MARCSELPFDGLTGVGTGRLTSLAAAQCSPELRDQLGAHYHEFRTTTATIASSATLIVQWLLEPDAVPDPTRAAHILAPLSQPPDRAASRVHAKIGRRTAFR